MSNSISKEHLNIWTDYILNYSLNGISKDDIVMVKGEKICWPLISVIQDKIFEAGAIADINIVPPDNDRGKVWGSSIARFGTTDQITKVPQWHIDRYNNMTKFIEILGTENPEFFQGQNDKLTQEVMKADEPIKNIRLAKPWVLTLFPTQAFAEMEDLSLEEYTKVIVNASMLIRNYLRILKKIFISLWIKAKLLEL